MTYIIKLGEKKDDAAILRLLSDNPMPGPISISYERNPSFFDSLFLQGNFNQVIVAKNENKDLVAFGTRSVQNVYIDGKPTSVGYLSNLRVDSKHRRKGILGLGMKFLKELDKDRRVDYYYSTVISQNNLARKIFGTKREDFPNFEEIDEINTWIVPLDQKGKKNSELMIRHGKSEDINEIISYLSEKGKQKEFFPQIRAEDFSGKNALKASDFLLAYKNSNLTGVVHVWDQSRWKQNIVKAYTSYMKVLKPIYNVICTIFNRRKFPEINEQFSNLYLSYFTFENEIVFKAILNHIISENHNSRYYYAIFSLAARDKLNKLIKDYRVLRYKSILYMVGWKQHPELLEKLRASVPYVEAARL